MQQVTTFKRPRALQACEVCRARKNRCSEETPCTYCVEHGLECTYTRQRNEKRAKTATTPLASDIATNPVASDCGRPLRDDAALTELMDTNLHTSSREFYGSASLAAFLRHIQRMSEDQPNATERSLASFLHNTDFRPDTSTASPPVTSEGALGDDRYHFRMAKPFLDAYFSNIHYIQPLFDKPAFYSRCEDLWFNKVHSQSLNFIALYHATMSLGCLVLTAEELDGTEWNRFVWSRKLFDEAAGLVARLGTATDIEMVQCFYMLAKVCQHELNPHVAFIFAGRAARTALAIGINRTGTSQNATAPPMSMEASQTWWAVYCLDIQTSFALGRPDSLGPDAYHTQSLPTAVLGLSVSPTDALQLVPHMVSLSRIMREVAVELYSRPDGVSDRLKLAVILDEKLDDWAASIPSHLREYKRKCSKQSSLKPQSRTSYAHKQAVVLRLRYLNLRMVMHAVSLEGTEAPTGDEAALSWKCQSHCVQSAEDTIEVLYEVYRTDDYFQTWWYNATYVLFAVSTLLAVAFRRLALSRQGLDKIFEDIDKAIAILQAMDDAIVVKNAITIIKRTLARARKANQPTLVAPSSLSSQTANAVGADGSQQIDAGQNNDGSNQQLQALFDESVVSEIHDLDWLNGLPIDTTEQARFWTEWAHELDMLGK